MTLSIKSSVTPFLEGHSQPTTKIGQTALRILGSVGYLHGALQRLRAEMYRRDIFKSYRPPCPVISVGNISAGGTGKTPMVLWLAQQLLAMQHPRYGETGPLAIVSRGYGVPSCPSGTRPSGQYGTRQAGVTIVADPNGLRLASPQAADEAVLLAQNLPGVVVLTGPDRVVLIRFAVEQYGAKCILMDDGFQHMRVQRDLDLVLVDAQHPFGNGYLLPGGILREQPAALQRCDAIIITRASDAATMQKTKALLHKTAPGKPILHADHQPKALIGLGTNQQLALSSLKQIPVLAFCGIARPDSFARLLATINTNSRGLHIFPDHSPFSRQDLAMLIDKARAVQAQALVCTEKDAVKIAKEWLTSELGEMPLFYLCMELVFPENPTWITNQLAFLAAKLPHA